MIRTPLILVNFKNYEKSTGKNAVSLAKLMEKLSVRYNVSIAVAPSTIDLSDVARSVRIPVFAQHTDPIGYGSFTGHVLPDSVKNAGAVGTLLNHAERKIDDKTLEDAVKRCRQLGLLTVVCAESHERAVTVARFRPDFIAVEPPELIGGDISVTTANPEIIQRTVQGVNSVNSQIKVLCGAGVKTGEDVRKALELGTVGVLLASGITKADNPEKAAMDLISGL